MNKTLRYALVGLGGVVALVAALVAYIAATFDPNDYKDELVELVQHNTQRTLTLDGDIRLAFWPDLAAELGPVRLSEHASEMPFAELRSARASVAVMPLLQGRVVVHKVELDGVQANIVRDRDGRFNFADLLSQEPKKSERVDFDVAYVHVKDSQMRYRDDASGTTLDVAGVDISTGRIREQTPTDIRVQAQLRREGLQARVDARADLSFDSVAGTVRSSALDVKLSGHVDGTSIDLQANSPLEFDAAKQVLQLPALVVSGAVKAAGLGLSGDLQAPVRLSLQDQTLQMQGLRLGLAAEGRDLPGGGLQAQLAGTLNAALAAQTARLNVDGTVDGNHLAGRIDASNWGGRPRLRFDLKTGSLDLDRYLAPTAQASKAAEAAATPPDLRVLHKVDVGGRLQAESLKVRGLRFDALDITLEAGDGRATLAPFAMRLFGGSARGNLRLDASAAAPSLAIQTQASQIDIAALLAAFTELRSLSGKGNLELDVTARGLDIDSIKRSLNGRGALLLSDGAVQGLDIGGSLREARSAVRQLTGKRDYSGNAQASTDFAELKASFTVRDGRVDNRDLELKGPLLRVTGAGTVDLASHTIDYAVKATLVASSQGQGGKERSQLAGLTVPVKVFGTLDKPAYSIDFASLVTEDTLQNLVTDPQGAKDALKDTVRDSKQQIRDLKDNVRDLKNLFGR